MVNNLFALPTAIVAIDGKPFPFGANLTSIRVQQRLSLPTMCEFTLAQSLHTPLRPENLQPGAGIRITFQEYQQPLFSGEVTAVEFCYGPSHKPELRVRAYDLMHRLRKQQVLRAYVQATFSELAREMAGEVGLVISRESPVRDSLIWQYVIQHQQTNLDILLEMAAQRNLYMTVRDSELFIFDLNGLTDVIPLTIGKDVIEAQVEFNVDQACRSVIALAWDTQVNQTHDQQATYLPDTVNGRAPKSMTIGNRPMARTLVNEAAFDDAHAASLAQAEVARRNAQTVTLRGIAYGDPRLSPGTWVDLRGGDNLVNRRYLLSNVTHTIDGESGYIVEFSTVLPQPPERPQATIAAPGIVTQSADPQQFGRVRVQLPTYGDVETDWMPVLTLGAGVGKGLVAQPQPGDSVLVLLTHGDPAQGVVLGSLYGMERLPVDDADPGLNTLFKFVTPAGQRIDIDDKTHTIRLQTGNGQFITLSDKEQTIALRTHDGTSIELSPDMIHIHAAKNLVLEAPGNSIILRGSHIDFQRG